MKHLVLYDGVCGLCNRWVRAVIRLDRRDCFRFASLDTAPEDLVKRDEKGDFSSIVVVENFEGRRAAAQRTLTRSRAVVFVLSKLGWGARLVGLLMSCCPARLADGLYRWIAARRYRMFGRHEICPIPPAKWRHKFVDLTDGIR